ncbi:hypothetical protein HGI30_16725 [Paenibacillus albicereus]|uniref:Uncharacterized protein n=1 Tax=Paenibacillus albicereus TaxID=2726185 RepID=A0A6H2H071_9BACL|nr:DUF6096 family protein [Paenibacillus albicereus]QJC53055.1 hypothetical protein HGI30_16725 [Paenibacillus albicereus]
MKYMTFEINGTDYKLRLGAAQIMELEKHLGGRNPLDVLMATEQGQLPSVTSTLRILHAAMVRFQASVSWRDVLDIYDGYVDNGNTYTDLLQPLIKVFEVSGFFKAAPAEESLRATQ